MTILRDGAILPLTEADQALLSLLAESEPAEPRREVPLQAVIARLMVLEAIPVVLAVLEQSPEAKERFLSIQSGIYADDEDARAVFIAAGVDPDKILA